MSPRGLRTCALAALLLAAAGTLAPCAHAGPRRLAFTRGERIWVADLDGSHARRVARGDNPEISPDGTRVAFNTDEPSRGVPKRRIAIVDVASARVTVLPGIPGTNAFGPTWSPDGTALMFENWDGDMWQIARVRADGSGYQVVRRTTAHDAWYGECWAPDGQAFWCHDLDSLYCCTLEGARTAAWSIAALAPRGGMSSASRIAVAPGGGALLMDVDMDEDFTRPDWDGPPPALWRFDVATGRAERLSAPGAFAWDGCWLDDSTYVHLEQGPRERSPWLWRASLRGGTPVRLARDVVGPSVSR